MERAQSTLEEHFREVAHVAAEISAKSIGVAEKWANELEVARLIAVINGIVLGYQIALGKTLGKSFTGLTQQLLNEVGDVLAVSALGDGSPETVKEAIVSALRKAGVARDIEVSEEPPVSKGRLRLRRLRVLVRDSVFSPIYGVLLEKGYREFPLSPEAMLVAAIVREYVRRRNPRARINVHARPVDASTIEIIVEEVAPLSIAERPVAVEAR